MVDISAKKETKRTAIAIANIVMGKKAFQALINNECPKGNVFETARVAGIMAAKATPQIIPMCHPLQLSKVQVSFESDKKQYAVHVTSEVKCLGSTGVEMEALAAANVAALTIYDMMKWADKGMAIQEVKLLKKTGGKSGDYFSPNS